MIRMIRGKILENCLFGKLFNGECYHGRPFGKYGLWICSKPCHSDQLPNHNYEETADEKEVA